MKSRSSILPFDYYIQNRRLCWLFGEQQRIGVGKGGGKQNRTYDMYGSVVGERADALPYIDRTSHSSARTEA